MAIVATVERRQIRYAHMVGVTPEIMMQGMRADYRLVDRLSSTLCERMRTARIAAGRGRARHLADGGVRSRAALGEDERHHQPRYWSNLPAVRCSRPPRRSMVCSSATAPPGITSGRSTATCPPRR